MQQSRMFTEHTESYFLTSHCISYSMRLPSGSFRIIWPNKWPRCYNKRLTQNWDCVFCVANQARMNMTKSPEIGIHVHVLFWLQNLDIVILVERCAPSWHEFSRLAHDSPCVTSLQISRHHKSSPFLPVVWLVTTVAAVHSLVPSGIRHSSPDRLRQGTSNPFNLLCHHQVFFLCFPLLARLLLASRGYARVCA